MKPVTVTELRDYLNKAIDCGCGNDVVVVSDDEEVNGVHALFSSDIKNHAHINADEPMSYINEKTKKRETANTIILF